MGHVAGNVVSVGRAGEAIVGVDGGVKRVAGSGGDGLVGAIAPRIVRPGQTFASLGGGRIGRGRQAVQRVVSIGAIEDLIASADHGHDIAVVGGARVEAVIVVLYRARWGCVRARAQCGR